MNNQSINEIKPVPESYYCQSLNAPLNIKNAQKLIENEPILLIYNTYSLQH
jgi:hypothetical protein